MLTNQLHQTSHYHHMPPLSHPNQTLSGFHPTSGASPATQHPHHATTPHHHHFHHSQHQQLSQLLHHSDSSSTVISTAALPAVQTSNALLSSTTSSSSSSLSSGWDRHHQQHLSSMSDAVTVSTVPHAASTHHSVQSSVPTQHQQQQQQQHECAGCHRAISERYLLRAVDRFWHEDCLKCSCCDCRLGEVGSTLFAKANLLLCRRDYLRLFGATGYCSACSKMIPAFEMVMKAKDNVYHLECFACQQCNHRFCIGDRYYLYDNKILCQFDYVERMRFARLSHGYGVMSQMKRQAGSSVTSLSCHSPTPHI